MLPLPGYDHMGRRVILGRWGNYDPQKFDLEDVTKASCIISDILLEEEEQATVTGYSMMMDCDNITMAHMVSYSPAMIKKSMVLWQVRTIFFFICITLRASVSIFILQVTSNGHHC